MFTAMLSGIVTKVTRNPLDIDYCDELSSVPGRTKKATKKYGILHEYHFQRLSSTISSPSATNTLEERATSCPRFVGSRSSQAGSGALAAWPEDPTT